MQVHHWLVLILFFIRVLQQTTSWNYKGHLSLVQITTMSLDLYYTRVIVKMLMNFLPHHLAKIWTNDSHTTFIETVIFAFHFLGWFEVECKEQLSSCSIEINRQGYTTGSQVFVAIQPAKTQPRTFSFPLIYSSSF